VVSVNVTARPDPTADPNVQAISDAQAEATRRFSRAQVSNFLQRAEGLHGVECGRSLSALRINSADWRYDDRLPGEHYDPNAVRDIRSQSQRAASRYGPATRASCCADLLDWEPVTRKPLDRRYR